jgi:hypothetical protein
VQCDVALGLANFGNILFYLRGHRALPQYPALVFVSTNIGVVALGRWLVCWCFASS